ncbi:peroxisomal sarcosine oxidase [Ciona intestinalis]
MDDLFDVIICGAGVHGLSTAKYLAEKQKKVLLVEQFPIPHSRGSSHGHSRIIRFSYPTSQHSQLMGESFRSWLKLEEDSGTKLFENCGLLNIGGDRFLTKVSSGLRSLGLEGQGLSASEINAKFPGLKTQKYDGVFEKTAGLLMADKCILALKDSALKLAVVIKECEKVNDIVPVNVSRVEVHTNNGKYRSKSVILTCGPWINKVLKPLNLKLPVSPLLIRVVYWKAKDPELYNAENFPSVIIDDKVHIYSTPILEYPGLMKICYHSGTEIDPDQRDKKLPNKDQTTADTQWETLVTAIKKYYPNIEPVPAVEERCIYSVTPDMDYILDRHPVYPNIIIGAGFSGHGFKCSPEIGRILGDMAIGNPMAYALGSFSLSRFNSSNL